jgi:hypothetical protein
MNVRAVTDRGVVQEIESAFRGVRRENGITFHEAKALDDYAMEDERVAARLLDRESRWEDVPDDQIEKSSGSILFYLDAIGFRYYLPAFMRWSVKNYGSGWVTADVTVRILDPSVSADTERYSGFTSEQAAAIVAFLRFVANRGDTLAPAALGALSFWERYEPLRGHPRE